MTDRDRLIDDINDWGVVSGTEALADRLIALGWTRRPYIGYWSASGDLHPEMLDVMKDELPKALAEGRQIVVVDGVTLRFHEVEPTLDEERLARAIDGYVLPPEANRPMSYVEARRYVAAAIAKVYREDTDAG